MTSDATVPGVNGRKKQSAVASETSAMCGKYRITGTMRKGATGYLYSAVVAAGGGDAKDGEETVLKIEECSAPKRQMQNEWQVRLGSRACGRALAVCVCEKRTAWLWIAINDKRVSSAFFVMCQSCDLSLLIYRLTLGKDTPRATPIVEICTPSTCYVTAVGCARQ